MALNIGTDCILSDTFTSLGKTGINEVLLLATKRFMFVIPYKSLRFESYRRNVTTSFSFDGIDPRQAVPSLLAAEEANVENIEIFFRESLADTEGEVIEIAPLDAFKITLGGGLFGWLKKGLYYKPPGAKGWKAVTGIKAKDLAPLHAFYADQLKPEG